MAAFMDGAFFTERASLVDLEALREHLVTTVLTRDLFASLAKCGVELAKRLL